MTFEQIYRQGVIKQKEQEEIKKAKKEGREPAFDIAAAE
jgi:hypothetical protein